jgi:hypothetical protein
MDSSSDNRRSTASSERVDGITGVGWISPTVQQADFPLAGRTATQTPAASGRAAAVVICGAYLFRDVVSFFN